MMPPPFPVAPSRFQPFFSRCRPLSAADFSYLVHAEKWARKGAKNKAMSLTRRSTLACFAAAPAVELRCEPTTLPPGSEGARHGHPSVSTDYYMGLAGATGVGPHP